MGFSLPLPRYCILCNNSLDYLPEDRIPLCTSCRSQIEPFPGNRCPRCGLPGDLSGEVCDACSTKRSPITSIRTPFFYHGIYAEIIRLYKHRGYRYLAPLLAAFMVPIYQAHYSGLPLVPVPASSSGKRERGYDQSLQLALSIAKSTDTTIWNGLGRKRSRQQKVLSREERAQNLSARFFLRTESAIPACAVLVDDVITTAATVEACGELLLKKGTKACHALALARDL